MPARLIWEEDHYIIEYSGVVELPETVNVYDEISRSPNFDLSRYGIIDCRQMQRVAYKPNEFHIHAAYSKAVLAILKRTEFRIAILVSNEQAEQGVLQFIESTKKYGHIWKRKVFWDHGEALAWVTGTD